MLYVASARNLGATDGAWTIPRGSCGDTTAAGGARRRPRRLRRT
jgi:hypothetical protein